MKGGSKSTLRPFLYRALHLFLACIWLLFTDIIHTYRCCFSVIDRANFALGSFACVALIALSNSELRTDCT